MRHAGICLRRLMAQGDPVIPRRLCQESLGKGFPLFREYHSGLVFGMLSNPSAKADGNVVECWIILLKKFDIRCSIFLRAEAIGLREQNLGQSAVTVVSSVPYLHIEGFRKSNYRAPSKTAAPSSGQAVGLG